MLRTPGMLNEEAGTIDEGMCFSPSMPPGMEDDQELQQIFTAAADASRSTYAKLLARLEAKFADQPTAAMNSSETREMTDFIRRLGPTLA